MESVEEHILSVTPIKSGEDPADADMLEFPPPNGYASSESEDGYMSHSAFMRKSPAERHDIYRTIYEGQTMALSEVGVPEECQLLPELKDEILKACLSHVTVVAKVWTNYDSAKKAFYLDEGRTKDCGKMYLSPKERQRLERLDPDVFRFSNVRLDIGTPFRNLAFINLLCEYKGPILGWKIAFGDSEMVDDVNSPHETLVHLVIRAMENISEDSANARWSGLTFEYLEIIAREFMFKPRDRGEEGQWFMKEW